MTINFNPVDTYADWNIALDTLAALLKRQSLCLFLGAGLSASSGEFPTWVELAKLCASNAGKDTSAVTDDMPINDLLKLMESVRDTFSDFEHYKEHVRKYLNEKFAFSYSHATNMLLIAIGALLIPSSRGFINEVITYNFDELLEWYLNLHGFKVQVVTDLPFLYEACDVRIYHPHGFLPKSPHHKSAQHFVFDSFEYDLNVGNSAFPWYQLCNEMLLRKIGIMVGLSGNDPAITSLVARTYSELEKKGKGRPIAFLLNRKASITNETSWYTKRGVVPLGFDTYDDIWTFLLNVCQASLEK